VIIKPENILSILLVQETGNVIDIFTIYIFQPMQVSWRCYGQQTNHLFHRMISRAALANLHQDSLVTS